MNELMSVNNVKTITTLEIAEMMNLNHFEILRKLDGSKDRKGYIDILGNNQMVVSDYFIKSTYFTEQNKEMPCYEVTYSRKCSQTRNGIEYIVLYMLVMDSRNVE